MRILVVEDDILIAMFACEVLGDAGHDVIGPAKTADEGLALAHSARPNLALLNIDLGNETKGTHLARLLFNLFGTPVLFVSGNEDEAWAAKDVALGYIGKPCKPSTLVKSVDIIEVLVSGAVPEAQHIPQGLTLFQMSENLPSS